MTRRPAAPAKLRNGLKWRDGRPRWEASPGNRKAGIVGMDLKDADGAWLPRGAATDAADARNMWANLVRRATQDDDAGGKARAMLRAALSSLPDVAKDPHARSLVTDVIEHGRALLEDREPDVTHALTTAPRSVGAMIDGFFADPEAMARISPATQDAYRKQAKKLRAKFGADQVADVTRAQLRKWYLALQSEISTSTANLALGAAGAMFRWATWQDPAWIENSPCDKLGKDATPGRLVFWTLEEETAFVAWCDANGFIDVADCVVACLWTGARQIDIAGIPDLEALAGETWRYVPQKTKRKQQEALPGILPPLTRRVDRRRREALASPVRHLNAIPYLWDARHNRRHTSDSIGDRFREARAAAITAGAMPSAFASKRLQDTRDTCVTRLWAALSRGRSQDNKSIIERIAVWGGWSINTCHEILRQHYLTLLEEGALATAAELRDWAADQGVDMTEPTAA